MGRGKRGTGKWLTCTANIPALVVIGLAFFGIAQYLVGFMYFAKMGCRHLTAAVFIGVVLLGQPPEGTFYFLVGSGGRQFECFIIVFDLIQPANCYPFAN